MKLMKQNLKGLHVRLKRWIKCNRYTALTVALVLGIVLPVELIYADLPAPKLNHQLAPLEMSISAPAFSLEDIDGESYTFESLRGKVVMVNFWATWCPPCRREIPSMESLYQSFKDEPFTILAINQWETPDHVFAYMGQLDVFPNFPILFDSDSTVSEAYDVKGLPTTLLINKEGEIVYRAVGGRDFNHPDIKNVVRKLLDVPGNR